MFSSFCMNLRALGLLSIAAALIATSCDKIPLFAPSGSTISLSAPKRVLQLNETVVLTAVVTEDAGTPAQNGTSVRFTTTLGSVDPVEAETRNGIATATFFAGSSSGVAEVRATSGAAGAGTGDDTATNVLTFTIGGASAASVVANASPTTVPSTGGSTTITATVVDALGNPLVGVPVTFSTDAGSLSSSTATTNANGRAAVTLTTTRTAKVTARVGAGGTSALSAEVTIGVASSVGVTLATSASPVAGQPVTLTVTGPTSGPLPSVVVTWGDGSSESLGTVSGARTASHVYSSPGSYTITASATTEGETTVASTGIVVSAAPSVTISANPTSGTAATQVFTFTVTPAGSANPTKVVVDFGDGSSTDLGAITTPTTVTHRYNTSAPGSFTVRATQTNANGTTSTAAVVITTT
jgi:hypothetical protein